MNSDSIVTSWAPPKAKQARDLCAQFLSTSPAKRFIFGRNVYSEALASQLKIAAFVDDFTEDQHFLNAPVIKSADIPADAFVLSAAGGRPLTARRLLEQKGVAHLDYFALLQWSGLSLPEAVFNEGFKNQFENNRSQIDWLFSVLENEESRNTLQKLLSFRYTYDLDYLTGFEEKQSSQYFEPFINVDKGVFVDVGGFDGATTETFIQRSPNYNKVYVFEPETVNFLRCKDRLSGYRDVELLPYGAGSKSETLRFAPNGSSSAVSAAGDVEIEIRRIDDVVRDIPTVIKMDIEGGEREAIDGARRLIANHRPALAICVYHRAADFWDIPRTILAMNPRYKVYLGHYTESIYETVMYFVQSN
jgi:FkbM family methyltransferase